MSGSDSTYEHVTSAIIEALEQGTVPWRRPWTAGQDTHRNPVSGTEYRGINPFLLDLTAGSNGYVDPRWVTFKQAGDRDGCVRKGERSTLVVFWKQLAAKDETTGEIKRIPLLRHYRVFNVAQVDGIDWPSVPAAEVFEPITRCAAVVDAMPNRPSIGHGGNRACYVPAWDAVQLPQPEQFDSPAAYYATTFHELTHSTGHRSRLNRPELADVMSFGDESYSREELTAEMGAAMLCGYAGISPMTIDASASYVASWLRVLKADAKMVVQAAGRAQRAADFILGREWAAK